MNNAIKTRLYQYYILMRFHKPIGILLLLWPTLWALWIAAKGLPHPLVLVVFILGVIIMRAAGCVINDFADRDFDGLVERTQSRPMVTKMVSADEAILLFMILSLIAFTLVLLMNTLTVLLSFIGILLAIGYPFMKRYTKAPQMILGLAFAWGIPMAFAAQTGHVPSIAWLLYLINILWIIAYDTEYAMVDREDDLKIGIKSTAILFGRYDVLVITLLHMIAIALLIWTGWLLSLHLWYYLGLIVAASSAVYQQFLIRDRQPKRCFKAFLNNHWLGLAVFVGIVLGFMG